MNDQISETSSENTSSISAVVGEAVRRQRQISGMSLRKLAEQSGISSAMVSRIENGQVSPSLSTLEALAEALNITVITFFADTVKTADVHFVKSGQGIEATRNFANHEHEFRVLGRHRKTPLEFESVSVTLERRRGDSLPKYINRGFVLISVTDGKCVYQCGEKDYEMEPGDSLSFNAELLHGVKEVITRSVSYISVAAKVT